jgi:hypothetical protein
VFKEIERPLFPAIVRNKKIVGDLVKQTLDFFRLIRTVFFPQFQESFLGNVCCNLGISRAVKDVIPDPGKMQFEKLFIFFLRQVLPIMSALPKIERNSE